MNPPIAADGGKALASNYAANSGRGSGFAWLLATIPLTPATYYTMSFSFFRWLNYPFWTSPEKGGGEHEHTTGKEAAPGVTQRTGNQGRAAAHRRGTGAIEQTRRTRRRLLSRVRKTREILPHGGGGAGRRATVFTTHREPAATTLRPSAEANDRQPCFRGADLRCVAAGRGGNGVLDYKGPPDGVSEIAFPYPWASRPHITGPNARRPAEVLDDLEVGQGGNGMAPRGQHVHTTVGPLSVVAPTARQPPRWLPDSFFCDPRGKNGAKTLRVLRPLTKILLGPAGSGKITL